MTIEEPKEGPFYKILFLLFMTVYYVLVIAVPLLAIAAISYAVHWGWNLGG
jgi:hypothetical protein